MYQGVIFPRHNINVYNAESLTYLFSILSIKKKTVKEKENSEFKPVKLRLKIDLVSYPARAKGLVNMDCQIGISIFIILSP